VTWPNVPFQVKLAFESQTGEKDTPWPTLAGLVSIIEKVWKTHHTICEETKTKEGKRHPLLGTSVCFLIDLEKLEV
jgi:hypothetical protein